MQNFIPGVRVVLKNPSQYSAQAPAGQVLQSWDNGNVQVELDDGVQVLCHYTEVKAERRKKGKRAAPMPKETRVSFSCGMGAQTRVFK